MNAKMGEALGRLIKPKARDYENKRKAYLVRLISRMEDAPPAYNSLSKEYWEEVDQHVSQLERTAGTVTRIFAEGVPGKGEDAKVGFQNYSPDAWNVVKPRIDDGATFERMEDDDLFGEMVDWTRLFSLPFVSRKVAETVHSFYTEVATKRSAYHIQTLNDSVKESEAALIFVGTPDLSIPEDMERFVVSPPSFDRLERWMKQKAQELNKEAAAPQRKPEPQRTRKEEKGKRSSGGLWIPD